MKKVSVHTNTVLDSLHRCSHENNRFLEGEAKSLLEQLGQEELTPYIRFQKYNYRGYPKDIFTEHFETIAQETGINCISLAHLYFREQLGITLPHGLLPTEMYHDTEHLETVDQKYMKPGDIVLLSSKKRKTELLTHIPEIDDTGDMINWVRMHVTTYIGDIDNIPYFLHIDNYRAPYRGKPQAHANVSPITYFQKKRWTETIACVKAAR